MKNDYIITFDPSENKIEINSINFINHMFDVEIYGDDTLLYRIPNQRANIWHRPYKNLVYCKKVSVKLIGKKESHADHENVDPYGEEDWTEDFVFLEKTWEIESDIKVKEIN